MVSYFASDEHKLLFKIVYISFININIDDEILYLIIHNKIINAINTINGNSRISRYTSERNLKHSIRILTFFHNILQRGAVLQGSSGEEHALLTH